MRAFLIILLTAVLATPALAAPACKGDELKAPFGAGPLANPRFADRLADRLSLTPEQADTLRGIATNHRDAMQTLAADHRDVLCGFFVDTQPDDPDYAVKAAAASQSAAVLAAGSVDLVAQLRTEFQAVLTDEQLAEWQVVKQEMLERRGKRKNRWRGDRGSRADD